MEDDPKVIVMGEDVGKLGGVFRVTDGLQKDFGDHRVLDTPLAESGIIGTAVGLAMRGYRPVAEIQFDGFVFPGFDQIISQVAKITYRTQGAWSMPMVIRIPFGGGIGAVEHHAESPESFFCHIGGLRVVACSNVQDAYDMLRAAIACDDPVIFFEPKRRYWEKGTLDRLQPADDAAAVWPPRCFSSVVRRPGTDVTVVSYGPSMPILFAAADAAADRGPIAGGHRSAQPVAAGPRPGDRIRPPDRPAGGRLRGAAGVVDHRRHRRPGHRGGVLLAGRAGAAGGRLRHPLPAEPAGGRVPARPGQGAATPSTACWPTDRSRTT